MRDLTSNASLRDTAKDGVSHEYVRTKVRRSAANPNGLYPYRRRKVLRLTVLHKKKRIDYIAAMPYNAPWRSLNRLKGKIIYDEKPFELGKPPNTQNNRYWADCIDKVVLYPMDKYPSKLHAMAVISYFDKGDIKWYHNETTYKRGIILFFLYI